jgi:hypothetical protein
MNGRIFEVLRNSFKSNWKIGGTLTLDELVWAWNSDDLSVVYLPGKPHEWGIKVMAICIFSTRTKYPYCFWFKPDLNKNITQVDILDAAHQTIGPTASFTADRWFGSLEWMNSHPNMLTTMALKKNQNELLFQLFGHDLRKGKYRVFSNGNIQICVWASEKIVKTASTCFQVQEENVQNLEAPQIQPTMSLATANTLKKISRDDLQTMCAKMGLSTGMSIL